MARSRHGAHAQPWARYQVHTAELVGAGPAIAAGAAGAAGAPGLQIGAACRALLLYSATTTINTSLVYRLPAMLLLLRSFRGAMVLHHTPAAREVTCVALSPVELELLLLLLLELELLGLICMGSFLRASVGVLPTVSLHARHTLFVPSNSPRRNARGRLSSRNWQRWPRYHPVSWPAARQKGPSVAAAGAAGRRGGREVATGRSLRRRLSISRGPGGKQSSPPPRRDVGAVLWHRTRARAGQKL